MTTLKSRIEELEKNNAALCSTLHKLCKRVDNLERDLRTSDESEEGKHIYDRLLRLEAAQSSQKLANAYIHRDNEKLKQDMLGTIEGIADEKLAKVGIDPYYLEQTQRELLNTNVKLERIESMLYKIAPPTDINLLTFAPEIKVIKLMDGTPLTEYEDA